MVGHWYRALSGDRTEVRLLSILRDETSAQVRCNLHHVSLDTGPPYIALSYAWLDRTIFGDDISESQTIILDDEPITVSANLAAALRSLRIETPYAWIDAICIDQDNIPERSAQVAIMKKIYSQAQKVLVWLGPQKDDSDLAMDFIEELSEKAEDSDFLPWIKSNQGGGSHVRQWSALQALLTRSWWTRTWAVQEFVLPRDVKFVCVQRRLDWDILDRTFGGLYHLGLSGGQLLKEHYGTDLNTPSMQRIVLSMYCRRWLQNDKSLSLLSILNFIHHTKCSDPRDKVYAILGIVTNPAIASIMPDYSLPVHKVYSQLVRRHIESTRNLDILGFVRTASKMAFLPGWVSDLSVTPIRRPLARTSLSTYDPDYRAASSTCAVSSFSEDLTVITCRGLVIDEVDGVSGAVVPEFQTESGEVQSVGSLNAYGDEIGVLDATWRAFVGDLIYQGDTRLEAPLAFKILFVEKCLNAEVELQKIEKSSLSQHSTPILSNDPIQACYPKIRHLKVAGRSFSDILLSHGPKMLVEHSQDVADHELAFGQRVLVMRAGTRFVTTKKGYIGLAPSSTERHDKVCVLLGCNVPMILWQGKDSSIIGDAYVHGLMHGEAIQGLGAGKYSLTDFVIR